MKNTKTLHATIFCDAYFESEIEVPSELSLEEAIEYAQDHLDEFPVGGLNFVDGSAEIFDEDCHFDD